MPGDARAGRRGDGRAHLATPSRRCCATSPSARSCPGTRLRVVDKQPFGGPLFVEVAGETHALGGQLATVDAGARREPADDARGRRAPRPARRAPEPPSAAARRCAPAAACAASSRMLGPAFVAAVAYIDPGNFATNIAGGAKYGYMLLWVIVAANLMAMLVQYLSAKTGIATGKNLPELCREHFQQARDVRPVAAGRGDRDRHRPRRVRRRRDRAQPALRRAAVRRRPDDRGRRVRDPRAADPRAPQVRARDHRLPRRSSSSASCTTCCRSASTRGDFAAGPDPALRRHRQRPARRRHPRRDRDAARRLPALGAHLRAGSAPRTRPRSASC